jgi:hypothetical protein
VGSEGIGLMRHPKLILRGKRESLLLLIRLLILQHLMILRHLMILIEHLQTKLEASTCSHSWYIVRSSK